MSGDQEQQAETTIGSDGGIVKKIPRTFRPKLRRALPTDRATVSKQFDILRAGTAASGPERKPVSNEDVSKIVNIHFGTISNCNPFFLESGLISRIKLQNIPCEEVFAYAERYKWDGDKAAHKLAPVMRKTWFCSALLPKLAFRSLSIDEAIAFLAEEAGATPEYKDQLAMLIEYLRVTGIVSVDGTAITAVDFGGDDQKPPPPPPGLQDPPPPPPPPAPPRDERLDKVHPSIIGLLDELPPVGTVWELDEMDGFLDAFKATLKFIYKVKKA
jgi:hypothetical protein